MVDVLLMEKRARGADLEADAALESNRQSSAYSGLSLSEKGIS
jgi:hypothetical protein